MEVNHEKFSPSEGAEQNHHDSNRELDGENLRDSFGRQLKELVSNELAVAQREIFGQPFPLTEIALQNLPGTRHTLLVTEGLPSDWASLRELAARAVIAAANMDDSSGENS